MKLFDAYFGQKKHITLRVEILSYQSLKRYFKVIFYFIIECTTKKVSLSKQRNL